MQQATKLSIKASVPHLTTSFCLSSNALHISRGLWLILNSNLNTLTLIAINSKLFNTLSFSSKELNGGAFWNNVICSLDLLSVSISLLN